MLLSFDDPDHHPALIERGFGEGRVILMTTSADKEWNNLADRPVYVVLMMELVQYLSRPSGGSDNQIVGTMIEYGLDPARDQPTARLRTPTYPSQAEIRLEAQPHPQTGIPLIRWPDTDEPGVYRFALDRLSGAAATHLVAVNVDPNESDLHRADRALLTDATAGLDVTFVRGDNLVGQDDLEARRELWPALLILVVIVLMSEQCLAWWFGSERSMGRWARGRAS